MKATSEGYQLFHEGSLALSQIEANGIRIDTEYLDRAIVKAEKKIKRIREELYQDQTWKVWQKTFGRKADINKPTQLAKVLFDVLGHPCTIYTDSTKNLEGAKRRPSTSEDALEKIDLPFARRYVRMEKLEKAGSTFLAGIKRETCNGYLHAFFHLNIARSFRSSSSDPNFQNFPTRDEEISRLVRESFIARKNHTLIEFDFKGIEVCGAACYTKDPVLIDYIKNPAKDMHRDMAMEIFSLEQDQVSKMTRSIVKNKFVFPEFYGSWYINCAPDLWDAIRRYKLATVDGVSLYDHLKKQGIRRPGDCNPKEKPKPGTFEKRVQEREHDFWHNRFKVYTKWKEKWWNKYQETGSFTTLTGFTYEGVLTRKEAINYPIQGSAFHCLLWCLIQLQKEFVGRNLKSKIVGQIHDSMLIDTHEDERELVLELVVQTVADLVKHWKWIIVPMSVEAEESPAGGSWYDKKPIELPRAA